jgi:hypothetical protein
MPVMVVLDQSWRLRSCSMISPEDLGVILATPTKPESATPAFFENHLVPRFQLRPGFHVLKKAYVDHGCLGAVTVTVSEISIIPLF